MIPTGRAVGAVETIKWLTRCSLISSAARLSGSAGPINIAPEPASSPAVASNSPRAAARASSTSDTIPQPCPDAAPDSTPAVSTTTACT